ncbi:choice-of-anchor I family protein [Oceanococcus atlanticus]|nr:choice-of-anchor I family protein [Oceanococcus atlanticus]
MSSNWRSGLMTLAVASLAIAGCNNESYVVDQPTEPTAKPVPTARPTQAPTPSPTSTPSATPTPAPQTFKLQLLHFADVDGPGGADDVRGFSALVDGFRSQMPDNTLVLSSGDNWIPGPEYFAAEDSRLDDVLGGSDAAGIGRAHVAWLNALGVQASVVGNHELDQSPSAFAGIIAADGNWPGAQFPYLSANIDFAADAATAGLLVADAGPAQPGTLSGSVTLMVDGETIGVVGASTPTLPAITSVGGLGVRPADHTDIDSLATIIQTHVNALRNGGVDKIIVLAHMQQIAVEKQLAGLLRGVDVIVAGGSNTILADSNDSLRSGDTAADTYPLQMSSASGEPVLVVNTNGDFTYLGRLVVEFDQDGVIVTDNLDPALNGAWRSDQLPQASFQALPAIEAITDPLETVLQDKDGNVFGLTSVFLEGRRALVRSEETNLGNLTADANLWYARHTDDEVLVSLKNGGGIRAEVGLVLQPPGTSDPQDVQYLPPQANASSGKPQGGVSQLDLETALRFNNGLVTLSVTGAELADIIEHGVSGADVGATPGSFPQVGGVRFSFDPSQPARDAGDTNRGAAMVPSRVRNLAVVDDSGAVIAQIIVDGALQNDAASQSFRLVTLNFIAQGCIEDASASCGDGYPYKGLSAPAMIDLSDAGNDPGATDFSATGGEQDALAEYLMAFFAEVPYDMAETPAADDLRIQNLDSVAADRVHALPTKGGLALLGSYMNPAAGFDEGAAEIVAFHAASERLFVINAQAGQVDVLDISNPAAPSLDTTLDPVADVGGAADGVNSVAVGGDLIAAAVEFDPATSNGHVAFYSATDFSFIASYEVGALPDAVTFAPDGMTALVANEGEAPADPNDGDLRDFANDVPGSISLVDLSNGAANASVTTLDFSAFNAAGPRAGDLPDEVRIEPAATSVANDIEPEYIAVSEDSSTAFVSLQENNAIAVIDIATATISQIIALGLKDHGLMANALDASDDDEVLIEPEPGVFGLHMPDGIATFMQGGTHYVLTANEGDSRDDVDECGYDDFANLDGVLAGRAADVDLGRLDFICNQQRDTDNDGDIDQLVSFGARSFSVVSSEGVVADSGDDFERVTAHLDLIDGRVVFNASNDNNTRQNRSDNKGPEPETVVAARVGERIYAFIGLERTGGIMLYDVTNPRLPRFMNYVNNRDFSEDPETGTPGDLGPEGIVFIPAADSPNGMDLLAVGNEISGTTSLYSVSFD